MNELTIVAYGTPGPQGSKRFVGMRGGKGIMVESSAKVKPWREAVKFAALDACNSANPTQQGHGMGCVSGPVSVEMVFTLPKPKSAPKSRQSWPDRKPDLSKLVRATEDALTDVGAWEDDARVVECTARKVFPNEGQSALHVPGVVIRIRRIEQ